jgi:hypothetical protein
MSQIERAKDDIYLPVVEDRCSGSHDGGYSKREARVAPLEAQNIWPSAAHREEDGLFYPRSP